MKRKTYGMVDPHPTILSFCAAPLRRARLFGIRFSVVFSATILARSVATLCRKQTFSFSIFHDLKRTHRDHANRKRQALGEDPDLPTAAKDWPSHIGVVHRSQSGQHPLVADATSGWRAPSSRIAWSGRIGVTFLLFAIAASAIVCSILLIAVIRRSLLRWVAGIPEWGWACALLITASLLYGEGESRSVGIVRFAANVALVGAFFMMYVSLRKLAASNGAYRVFGAVVGILVLILGALTAIGASYTARAVCVLTTHIVLFSACAMTLWKMRDRGFAETFTRSLFVILAVLSVLRIAAIAVGAEQSDILQAESPYQRGYLLAFASCIVALVFGYMMLVYSRVKQMLQRVSAVDAFDDLGDAEKAQVERDLAYAIERSELILHFQPRASLRTHAIVGVEALVRWNHPARGTLLPTQFVPIGEQTAAILAIGEWVMNEAAAVLERLHAGDHAGIAMSINVSARQLDDNALPRQIEQLLSRASFNAHQLELELTESSVIGNRDTAARVLAKLKDLGVRLAVDDFGTGYSSLAYIKNWPIDCVKIDRSFVRDLPHNSDDAAITRAITSMGHALGLQVVAEGVEREEQLAFLRELGCDEYQGFLISEPLPEDELVHLLGLRRAQASAAVTLSAMLADD